MATWKKGNGTYAVVVWCVDVTYWQQRDITERKCH